MTYEDVRGIVGVAGMLLFIMLFAGVLIYTFWPGNKKRFERARHIPLDDDPDVEPRRRRNPEDKSSSRGKNGH